MIGAFIALFVTPCLIDLVVLLLKSVDRLEMWIRECLKES